jgi:hypothetical protein
MSKSTNTVVYFDWKTVIYIYVCRKCRTQFMLPMEKSVTFTGACANEIIPNELALLLTKQEKEVMLEFVIQCIHVLNFHLNWKLCGEQYNLSWNIKPCHAVLFGGGGGNLSSYRWKHVTWQVWSTWSTNGQAMTTFSVSELVIVTLCQTSNTHCIMVSTTYNQWNDDDGQYLKWGPFGWPENSFLGQ